MDSLKRIRNFTSHSKNMIHMDVKRLYKALWVIFLACMFFDYFVFLFNVISVANTYGFLKIWQPIVTNADKLGLGTIYLIIADKVKKEGNQK